MIGKSKQQHEANQNDHMAESLDPEVWILGEASQMFKIGLLLMQRAIPGIAEHISVEMSSRQQFSAQCALQLLVDAWIADEKCVECTSKDLLLLANVHAQVLPKLRPTSAAEAITLQAFQLMFSMISFQVAPLGQRAEMMKQQQTILTDLIKATEGNPDKELRKRLSLLRSFLQLMHNKDGAKADLDTAIKIHDDPQLRQLRVNLTLAVDSLHAYKSAREDLEIYVEVAHPDARDLHTRCYMLAAVYSRMNLKKQGIEMYRRAVEAEQRFQYLFGEPMAGNNSTDYRKSSVAGSLRDIAERSFGGVNAQCIPLDQHQDDFVLELAAMVAKSKSFQQYEADTKKPKPNDPCKCGSGKKWKKCCSGKKPNQKGPPRRGGAQFSRHKLMEDLYKDGQQSVQKMMGIMNIHDAQSQQKQFRMQLSQWTDMCINDNDPYGDGDQRIILDPEGQQAHRDVWAMGADILICFEDGLISEFGMACMTGCFEQVRDDLTKASAEKKRELLEFRETTLRLSPVLLTIVGSKHFQFCGTSPIDQLAGLIDPSGGDRREMKRTKVVEELLSHGARPDARDVYGKTAVHYGAGSMATDESMELVQLCIDAADRLDISPRLVDIQDRGGMVAMHEVVMGNRIDMCKFLVGNGANIQLASYEKDGPSPLKLANPIGCPEMSTIMSAASTEYARKARKDMKDAKKDKEVCHHCGSKPADAKELKNCSKCMMVKYCR